MSSLSSSRNSSATSSRCGSVDSDEEPTNSPTNINEETSMIKIVIIGSNESMKSSLQTRLAHTSSSSFNFGARSDYETTFGRNFRVRHLIVDGSGAGAGRSRVRAEIWKDEPSPSLKQYQSSPADPSMTQSLAEPPPTWTDAHAVVYVHDDQKVTENAAVHPLAILQKDRPYLPITCVIDTGRNGLTPANDDTSKELISRLGCCGDKMDLFHVSLQDGRGIERMLVSVVRNALGYKLKYRDSIASYLLELQHYEQASAAWKLARAAKQRSQIAAKCSWWLTSHTNTSRSALRARQEFEIQ